MMAYQRPVNSAIVLSRGKVVNVTFVALDYSFLRAS